MNLGLWGSISPKTVLGAIRRGAGGDTLAPTLTISVVSVTANVAAMQIVASEVVSGFAVGDITISAGGSLASFATADNITFTVSWTLADGTNTMDIAGGVCQDAAGNANAAATQHVLNYLTLQPDATAGVDAFIYSGDPGVNYGADDRCIIGGLGANPARQLIKFDLTSIAAGSTIYSAILSLYATADNSSNARTHRVYRLKRAWVEGTRAGLNDVPPTGAIWTRYDTTNNWQTAGGFGADDCEQTDIGSRAMTATETLNEFKHWTLTASAVQAMISSGAWTNNGFLMKADTENTDAYVFASSDNVTAGNRPKLAIVYAPPFP